MTNATMETPMTTDTEANPLSEAPNLGARRGPDPELWDKGHEAEQAQPAPRGALPLPGRYFVALPAIANTKDFFRLTAADDLMLVLPNVRIVADAVGEPLAEAAMMGVTRLSEKLMANGTSAITDLLRNAGMAKAEALALLKGDTQALVDALLVLSEQPLPIAIELDWEGSKEIDGVYRRWAGRGPAPTWQKKPRVDKGTGLAFRRFDQVGQNGQILSFVELPELPEETWKDGTKHPARVKAYLSVAYGGWLPRDRAPRG